MNININELTLGQIRELTSILACNSSNENTSGSLNRMVGKKVIIRTYSAGVWFGLLSEKEGNEVILKNARRLWGWQTKESISLSSVALHGIDNSNSKIAAEVGEQWLEAIEITPCTDSAIKSLEGADVAKRS